MDELTVARMLERGEISEENIMFQISHDFEVPPGCTDLSSIIESQKIMTDRLMVLKQAHLRFSCLSKMSNTSGLEFERYYRDLYDDIQEHRDLWFEKFFNVDNPDPTHAEFTTGILGTLCTILRQRGDIKQCVEVMETYMAVLSRYQQMTEGCGDEDQVNCCAGLTYKANLIRINLGSQLPDKQMAVEAFRAVVKHEQKEKELGTFDEEGAADYDLVYESFFGHRRYDEVSDDDIFKALTFMCDSNRGESNQLELRSCGCCQRQEDMYGDYRKCSRCNKQAYCSKEVRCGSSFDLIAETLVLTPTYFHLGQLLWKCQTIDWKAHKHLCGDKNTTNVDPRGLLLITQLLVSNHTRTCEVRGHSVSKSHQQNAKAGESSSVCMTNRNY